MNRTEPNRMDELAIFDFSCVEATGVCDWSTVPPDLACRLPDDYKQFISRHGVGRVGDFIWILSPFEEKPELNIRYQKQCLISALAELTAGGEAIPEPIADLDDLIPIAITDNGDVFYWLSSPLGGVVAVNEARGPEWCFMAMEFMECLGRYLCGDLAVPFLPKLNLEAPVQYARPGSQVSTHDT